MVRADHELAAKRRFFCARAQSKRPPGSRLIALDLNRADALAACQGDFEEVSISVCNS
jgi:hypothetical protein